MMKKIFILLVLVTCIFGNVTQAQEKNNYVLSGTYEGLPDKTKVYMTTQERDTVQRTISEGNRFTFKGKLPLDGRFHFIKFDTLVSKVISKAIFISNKPITIKGILGTREVEVSGSAEQGEYLAKFVSDKPVDDRIKLMLTEFDEISKRKNDSIKTLTNLNEKQMANEKLGLAYIEIIEKVKAIQRKNAYPWFIEHKGSLVAPWFLFQCFGYMQADQIKEIFELFTPEVKNSYYGNLLKIEIEGSLIKKGSIIPNLVLKNIQGKVINVHDEIKGNKYTLIDCWASWCKPCRAEIPKLKEVYAKYKGKGLNILGVSSDKSETAWKKAVADDKTDWSHLLQIDGNLGNSFGIKAIPAYILVDGEGKMIAFDCALSNVPNFGGSLRQEGLDKTLEALLGK